MTIVDQTPTDRLDAAEAEAVMAEVENVISHVSQEVARGNNTGFLTKVQIQGAPRVVID